MQSRAPWHTIIILFLLFQCVVGILSALVDRVEENRYNKAKQSLAQVPSRCPDYLKDKAKIYIDDVEEFYDYVCSQAEYLGVPAEFLLMCFDKYSGFNYKEGLTAITSPDKSAVDQVKDLDYKSFLTAEETYLLLVHGVFRPTEADLVRTSTYIKDAYPTVYRINEEINKIYNEK